jgi:hypothetical protein
MFSCVLCSCWSDDKTQGQEVFSEHKLIGWYTVDQIQLGKHAVIKHYTSLVICQLVLTIAVGRIYA